MIATTPRIATVEALSFSPQIPRADETLTALLRAAGLAGARTVATTEYRGASDLLLLWGPGAPNRFEPIAKQVASGGHVACFDLAYWHRERKVRVSIDRAHPQGWVLRRNWPTSRVEADRIRIAEMWAPNGHVMVAGLGDKARVQYGAAAVDRWEAEMMAEARARGYQVVYRPKRTTTPIEDALKGAALVITWHSNVAVDAIRMGVPVICRDGAAAAICPSVFGGDHRPLPPDWRDQFLANLAWFQWDMAREADECWAFLNDLLS